MNIQNVSLILVIFLLTIVGCRAPNSASKANSPSTQSTRSKSYPSSSELRDRREYIQRVENSFNDEYQVISLTIIGEYSDTLQVSGDFIESEFAEKFTKRSDIKRPLRQRGFDHVVITNGKRQWKYDLWNDN